jgi:hypothetical protein
LSKCSNICGLMSWDRSVAKWGNAANAVTSLLHGLYWKCPEKFRPSPKIFLFLSDFHSSCSISRNWRNRNGWYLDNYCFLFNAHTKVVSLDPTRNLTFVCSIVWKSRIIQTRAILISLRPGNTGWQIRITQDMKYLGALALLFARRSI